MTEHTKGPWTLDASRMVLAPCSTGELSAIVDRVRGGSPEQANANARLIAASPDLLFALKGLLADITEYQTLNNLGGEDNHWQVIARAAIAKAER